MSLAEIAARPSAESKKDLNHRGHREHREKKEESNGASLSVTSEFSVVNSLHMPKAYADAKQLVGRV